MNNTIFILNTVTPIFLIVVMGWVLRKIGVIHDEFIKQSVKFVFNVTLPILVFLKLTIIDINALFESKLIILVYACMLILFFICWLVAKLFIKKGNGRGVFIQGGYWPNNVIIGLALIMNIFGDEAASKMVMILIFLIPLDYMLSVVALTISDRESRRNKAMLDMIKSIALNPIIISSIVAVVFSVISIPVPTVLINTGNYIAAITLPLALIGIGGSLKIKLLKNTSLVTIGAAVIKLLISPILATLIGVYLGYNGTDLGIIFIIFACPTAIVSFILADAMTPHGEIAGNIVLTTTLASAITIPIGLLILTSLNLL